MTEARKRVLGEMTLKRSPSLRFRRAIRVAAAFAALSGCGTDGHGRPTDNAGGDGRPPVDMMVFSASDMHQVDVAQAELVRRCMKERGFRYSPDVPPAATDDAAHTAWKEDLRRPRADETNRGYYWVRGKRESVAGSPADFTAAEESAWQAAFSSPPDQPATGCLQSAWQRLFGSPENANNVRYFQSNLFIAVKKMFEQSAEGAELSSSWIKCMKAATGEELVGVGVPAFRAQQWRDAANGATQITPEEIDLATKDAICTDQIGRSRWEAAMTQAHTETIRRSRSEVVTWNEVMGSALQRAREVLAQ